MDIINLFSVYTHKVLLIIVFLLYILRFLKEDNTYKILTLYISLCLLKLLTYHEENLYWFILAQTVILASFYFTIYTKKIQLITLISLTSLNILLTTFFKYNYDVKTTNIIVVLASFITLFTFGSIQHYNKLDNEKKYCYFNTGLLLFLFLYIVFNLGMQILTLITDKQIYNKQNFITTNALLEILFIGFKIKQWLVIRRKNK